MEEFLNWSYLKIALVIFAIVSIPVIYILWKNPSAENNSTHILTLLGAVFLVIISVTPYLKIDKKTEFSNFILFRDGNTKQLVAGSFQEPYFKIYTYAFNTISSSGTEEQITINVGPEDELKLVEKAILFQLLADFNNRDWDSDAINYRTDYSSGMTGSIYPGTQSEYIIFDSTKLQSIFSGNKYLYELEVYQSYKLKVPPKTTIKRTATSDGWNIIFENPDFKIVIELVAIASGNLFRGAWGVFKGDAEQYNRYTQVQYTIMTHAETKFGKRYTEHTEAYWKWYEGIVQSVKKFDWKNVDTAILEKKSRDALWQDVSLLPPDFSKANE